MAEPDLPPFAYEAAEALPVSGKPIIERPDKKSDNDEATTKPPSVAEWQDFFGRTVLTLITEGYLYLVLGDVMDQLTPSEASAIALSKEELREMSAPLASFTSKTTWGKKHGRSIIAAADSFEAVFNLLMWMRRVQRVAKKYRKPKQQKPVQGTVVNRGHSHGEHDGQASESLNGQPYAGLYNPGSG